MIKLAIFSMLIGSPFAQTVPVKLQWDTSLNASYYTLYWGPHSKHYGHSIQSTSTTATASVPSGKTVYFAVTATDTADRESGFSNEVIKAP